LSVAGSLSWPATGVELVGMKVNAAVRVADATACERSWPLPSAKADPRVRLSMHARKASAITVGDERVLTSTSLNPAYARPPGPEVRRMPDGAGEYSADRRS
jgi:hypothetical protein